MSALEQQIDELYQAPLEEFTARRNALAKTLKGADAQRVKKLAKPTVVPWAANQLYWKARATYDRLLDSGERVRKAQIGALEGRAADVRAVSDAHRKALSEAVKEASRLASASGVHPVADALMRTFEALSLKRDGVAEPGRLTEALQPAGFEALAGVPVHAVARPKAEAAPAAAAVRLKPESPRTDPRKEADARKREAAARKHHEAEVRKAEAALDRARAAATLARKAADHADRAVATAEAELTRLRAQSPKF